MDGSEKPKAMGQVIQVDEARIRAHLGEMVCTTIKTDNHHLIQDMRRSHSSLLGRGRCQMKSELI